MTEWQTMESAPKDGRFILAYEKPNLIVVSWDDDTRSWEPMFGENPYDVSGRFFLNPTHWQPLPDSPERTDT